MIEINFMGSFNAWVDIIFEVSESVFRTWKSFDPGFLSPGTRGLRRVLTRMLFYGP